MRDALHGLTRFEEFQKSLGIAPNMLTRRLNALVETGLLERHRYSIHPPRDEYRPTALGRDFRSVLIALLAFGNRHFAPEGASVTIVDARTGAEAEPIIVDRATGRPIREPDFAWIAGPAASERTQERYARRRQPEAAPQPGPVSNPRIARNQQANTCRPAASSASSQDEEKKGGDAICDRPVRKWSIT